MTDGMQGLRDDLAYMSDLVRADDLDARRRGGALMAAGGAIFASCSLVCWVSAMGWVPAPPSVYGWSWLVGMVLFFVVLFVRGGGRTGATGVRARAYGVMWSAVGSSIGVIVLCCIAAAYATGSNAVWAVLPSIVFTLYGAGWTVAASLSGERWQRLVALGAFSGAVFIAFLSHSAVVYLAYAIGLFLLAGAPGLVLMSGRGARRV